MAVTTAVAIAAVAGAACGTDRGPAATTLPTTTLPGAAASSTTAVGTTLPEEPEITIPAGVLAAMPFQNRLDVAQGIFQIKLYNGTADSLDVVGVQLVWAGMTTEVAHRENQLAAGDRLDYPVPLAPATCVGDGDVAQMPDPGTGVAKVYLRDGTVLDAPVYDVKHFARMLYLQDCERQLIERTVDIGWADLREADWKGRPVTVGVLRLVRREGSGAITVLGVLNTINYTVFAGDAATATDETVGDGPLGTMAEGATSLDVPARFQEGRCDVHALSESSQPFKFVVLLDLGDGVQRSLSVVPSAADQEAMKERVLRACHLLGEVGFVGQDELGTTTTAG